MAMLGAANINGVPALGLPKINNIVGGILILALAASPLVVPGRPEESAIFARFTPSGPMFGVFTEEERTLWADWIRSLGREQEVAQQRRVQVAGVALIVGGVTVLAAASA